MHLFIQFHSLACAGCTSNQPGFAAKVRRIWSAVIIVAGLLMLVMEILEAMSTKLASYPFFENFIPLTLALAVVGLVIAWRWEGLGGIVTVIGLAINLGHYMLTGRTQVGNVLLTLTSVLIPAVLFIICWQRAHWQTAVS